MTPNNKIQFCKETLKSPYLQKPWNILKARC